MPMLKIKSEIIDMLVLSKIIEIPAGCYFSIPRLPYPKLTTGRVDPSLWKPGEYSEAW